MQSKPFLQHQHDGLAYLTSPLFSPSTSHALTQATHGASQGAFAQGNFSYRVEDDPKAVDANYAALKRAVGYTQLAIPRQVHGCDCQEIAEVTPSEAPEADALWTRTSGMAVGILTADCVPILLEMRDDANTVCAVAAIHAGWRGALANIVGQTLAQMRAALPELSPHTSRALIGASICTTCFEVGADVADQFREKGYDAIIHLHNGVYSLDLWALTSLQLRACSLQTHHIATVGHCTRHDAGYFSYRRSPQTGRNLSLVCMP
ncbi:polyphenol oxidase family protein [Chrysiogenes arsenatis]|uniref:polyphenol oxidase family protein n=1 Tax=Chrysiogenes arsenatis TaxID=309797 RepID=UPI000422FDAB|nr:polyphenol oxidase family protein [Chrysiogenes arsenatis]